MKNNNTSWFFRIVLFLFLPAISFSQGFWPNTSITGGFAVSAQDRRLFHFPGAEDLLRREDSILDYEYNLSLQMGIVKSSRFATSIGIGYSVYTSYFSRPFDHRYLSGSLTKEGRYIKRYTINKLILPISNKWLLGGDHNLFLKFDILPQAAFRKRVIDFAIKDKKRFTKRQFEWQSLAIYPGIGLTISPRFEAAAHCRLIYIQKLDEVIFNSLLFYQRNPEFLRKEYDDHNPFQLWFTVSYLIGKNG
jgi:hypothetical protein